MREVVADNNVYRWAGKILSAVLKLDFTDSSGDETSGYSGTPFVTGEPDRRAVVPARSLG